MRVSSDWKTSCLACHMPDRKGTASHAHNPEQFVVSSLTLPSFALSLGGFRLGIVSCGVPVEDDDGS